MTKELASAKIVAGALQQGDDDDDAGDGAAAADPKASPCLLFSAAHCAVLMAFEYAAAGALARLGGSW